MQQPRQGLQCVSYGPPSQSMAQCGATLTIGRDASHTTTTTRQRGGVQGRVDWRGGVGRMKRGRVGIGWGKESRGEAWAGGGWRGGSVGVSVPFGGHYRKLHFLMSQASCPAPSIPGPPAPGNALTPQHAHDPRRARDTGGVPGTPMSNSIKAEPLQT